MAIRWIRKNRGKEAEVRIYNCVLLLMSFVIVESAACSVQIYLVQDVRKFKYVYFSLHAEAGAKSAVKWRTETLSSLDILRVTDGSILSNCRAYHEI